MASRVTRRFLQWALPTAVVLAALLFLIWLSVEISPPRSGSDGSLVLNRDQLTAAHQPPVRPAQSGAPTIDGAPIPKPLEVTSERHSAGPSAPPLPSARPTPSGPSATPGNGRKEAPSKSPSIRVASVAAASPTSAAAAGATLRGAATWYANGPGFYAAAHGYIDGTVVVAVVNSFHDGRTWSVTVTLETQCAACRWTLGATLIDLSPSAFRALGWPLSRGIAPVEVVLLEGSRE